jgi:hypothetical protein
MRIRGDVGLSSSTPARTCVAVLVGEGHHTPQIAFDEPLAGSVAPGLDPSDLALALAGSGCRRRWWAEDRRELPDLALIKVWHAGHCVQVSAESVLPAHLGSVATLGS